MISLSFLYSIKQKKFFIFDGWKMFLYNYEDFFIIIRVYMHWLYIFALCLLIWLMSNLMSND